MATSSLGAKACSSGSEGPEAASALLQLAASAPEDSPMTVGADDVNRQTETERSIDSKSQRSRRAPRSNRPVHTRRSCAPVDDSASLGAADEQSIERVLSDYNDLSTDALKILKTFFTTQILDGAISLLNLSFPATLVPLLLLRCGTRGGVGGRLKREDPHQDPTVDPKKADRVLNNRLAAARSKLKQKMAKRSLELMKLHKLYVTVHASIHGSSSSSLQQHQYSAASCESLAKELIAILGPEDRIPNPEQQEMIKQVELKAAVMTKQLEVFEKQSKSGSSAVREPAAAMDVQQVEVQRKDEVETPADAMPGGLADAAGLAAAAATNTAGPGMITSPTQPAAAATGSGTAAVTVKVEAAADGSIAMEHDGAGQTSAHQYQQQQCFQADVGITQAWQHASCLLPPSDATTPSAAAPLDDEYVDILRSGSSDSSNSCFASAAAPGLQQQGSLLKRCPSCSCSESLSGLSECEVSRESWVQGQPEAATASADGHMSFSVMLPAASHYAAHGIYPEITAAGMVTDRQVGSLAGVFAEGTTGYSAIPHSAGHVGGATSPAAGSKAHAMLCATEGGSCDAAGLYRRTATAAGVDAAAAAACAHSSIQAQVPPCRPNYMGYYSLMNGWCPQPGASAADCWCNMQQQHLASSSQFLQYSNAARVLHIPGPSDEAVASAYAAAWAAHAEAEAAAAAAAAVTVADSPYKCSGVIYGGFDVATAAAAAANGEQDTDSSPAAKVTDQNDVNPKRSEIAEQYKRSTPVLKPVTVDQTTASRATACVPTSVIVPEATVPATYGGGDNNILYECDKESDVIMILADCGLGSSDVGGSLLCKMECQF